MLIGIKFPAVTTKDEKVEELKKLVANISGKVRIYEPSSLDTYIDAVKKYDARKKDEHLILLRTHYNYADTLRNHDWRMHDYYFDFKGGTQWGVPVEHDSITYQEDTEDYAKIAATASWAQSRASIVRKIGSKYLGSTTFEPHTILVGYGIEYPASSYPMKCILGSLPEDWWRGAALLRMKDFNGKAQNHFEFSNIVSIGDATHEALTDLGIEHGAIPKPPYAAYHGKIKRYSPKWGVLAREVAKSKEDMRSWTE